MGKQFDEQDNNILDRIIKERHTVRKFKNDIPAKEEITAIIDAGLHAPYAAMAVGRFTEYRHFFVLTKRNPLIEKIGELLKHSASEYCHSLKAKVESDPSLNEKAQPFLKIQENVMVNGLPGLPEAPCLIIAAERRGIPDCEMESLAHVIQNMWLKSTAMGLGLRLISAVEPLTYNEEFSQLLGLNYGDYAFAGCIIGYESDVSAPKNNLNLESSITWL